MSTCPQCGLDTGFAEHTPGTECWVKWRQLLAIMVGHLMNRVNDCGEMEWKDYGYGQWPNFKYLSDNYVNVLNEVSALRHLETSPTTPPQVAPPASQQATGQTLQEQLAAFPFTITTRPGPQVPIGGTPNTIGNSVLTDNDTATTNTDMDTSKQDESSGSKGPSSDGNDGSSTS